MSILLQKKCLILTNRDYEFRKFEFSGAKCSGDTGN
jgi:hypothetical protein